MNESAAGRVFTVLFTIILFVIILYLAYLTTRYIGKKYSAFGGVNGKNIKVIDRMAVSQDKLLMIVKAGGKTMLIGVSKDHMEFLSELDESQLTASEDGASEEAPLTPDFVSAFKTVLSDKMKNLKAKENKDEKKQ